MTETWRNGRSVGRTIYRMVGTEASKDDVLIGVMDTSGLAARVVAAVTIETRSAALRVAVGSLLTAQGRMLDDWAEANEERRRELWQRLHEEADRVRDVLGSPHSPAEPVSPVSTATEAPGGAGEAP